MESFAEGFFPQDQSFNPNSIGLDTGVSAYDGGLPIISVGQLFAHRRDLVDSPQPRGCQLALCR